MDLTLLEVLGGFAETYCLHIYDQSKVKYFITNVYKPNLYFLIIKISVYFNIS